MSETAFDLNTYCIRRKVLKIFGASFHVYDPQNKVVAFSSQAAFKLKEDIRIYTDESKATELMQVRARQIVDFSAAYDLIDSREERKIGAARRKGWSSLLRDAWELLDADDRPLGKVQEDSRGMALARRLLSNLIPQTFRVEGPDGTRDAEYAQRFNPFVYRMDVRIQPNADVDRRILFGAAVLLAAIEGRQG